MNILVAGTVRNCARTLRKEVKRIKRAFRGIGAGEVYFFIVESDSHDQTLSVMEELADSDPNFSHLSLGELASTLPNRLQRLAFCRNKFMEKFDDDLSFDFLVIADFDGTNRRLSSKSLEAIATIPEDWGAIAANQLGGYYDIGALRAAGWSDGDPFEQMSQLEKAGMSRTLAHRIAVLSKMVKIPTNEPAFSVQSAYGGFCLYKRSAVQGLRFDTGEENEVEFVKLNQAIRQRGFKIYIAPSLVNEKYNEHSIVLSYRFRSIKILASLGKRVLAPFFSSESLDFIFSRFKRLLSR